ncbi:MAG: GWxTD domain-containing protein [Actinobacteria bacterium]|nr:GWxTD domain-containing protein [Actinomycetota bacterium]
MKNIFYLMFTAILLFSFSTAFGQAEMRNYDEVTGPRINYDISNVAVPDHPELSRINIYVEIKYDELQFVKMPEGYEASYETSVLFLDKDGDQADGKIWTEDVDVARYDETNKSDKYSYTHATFDLPPGSYKLAISVQDEETEKINKSKKKIKLRDFSKNKLVLSDITFVKKGVPDSLGKETWQPVVTNRGKGLRGNIAASFEIYNPIEADEVRIRYEIFGINTKDKYKKSFTKQLSGKITNEFIPLTIDSLAHDTYKLTVNVNAGKKKANVKKYFYIRWSGLPTNARDLNAAIEQVRYIATRKEWKILKKAKGEDRIKEFKLFWKRHDPTPGTEANEAMEAHYGRVAYANQNFSVMQREGWRTDMGMVFIILGAPDDIERNPYPSYSKPYQIWRYYRYNRELIFYDQTGFGDYRLYTPFSIYEFQRYLRQ